MLIDKKDNYATNIQFVSQRHFGVDIAPYKLEKAQFIEIPLLIPEKDPDINVPATKKKLYALLDFSFSMAILAPLVVGFWRGTWVLMDLYSNYIPTVGSFVIGMVLHWIFVVIRSSQQEIVSEDCVPSIWKRVEYQIYRFVYLYCFVVAIILHWRAGWLILDSLNDTFQNRNASIIAGFGCIVPLVVLKSVRNLIAIPQVIVKDTKDLTFAFPTRFRAKSSQKNTPIFFLDCLFSVFVIGTLVVFVWRGAWVLFDMYLFPDDEPTSAFGSLILGYTIAITAFLLQPLMRWLCSKTSGVLRIIIADIYLLFSFIGTVNVWRGIWNILNLYYLPDEPELSCWSTHIVFLVLLILLKCSNSVLVRGVYIDAEEPGGKCVIFPCYYLRLYFQNERAKKYGRSGAQNENLLSPAKNGKQQIDCDFTKPHLCACHINSDNNSSVTNHITVSIPLVHSIKEFGPDEGDNDV